MNDEIRTTFQSHLTPLHTRRTFATLWAAHAKSRAGRSRVHLRPLAVALLVMGSLLAVGFTSNSMALRRDRTDLPFRDDPRIIGVWEAVDYVQRPEGFVPKQKSFWGDPSFKFLAFGADGVVRIQLQQGHMQPSSLRWTQDHLLNSMDHTDSAYEIMEIAGDTFLFFEWKSGDYTYRGADPWFYVLKRTDTRDVTGEPLVRAVVDPVDQPFVDDPTLIGRWETVDFVSTQKEFLPNVRQYPDVFYIDALVFEPDGQVDGRLAREDVNGHIEKIEIDMKSHRWTKGLLLFSPEEIAERLEIRTIEGADYLFYEWKSGDVIIGGRPPHWYVLKRVPSSGEP